MNARSCSPSTWFTQAEANKVKSSGLRLISLVSPLDAITRKISLTYYL